MPDKETQQAPHGAEAIPLPVENGSREEEERTTQKLQSACVHDVAARTRQQLLY